MKKYLIITISVMSVLLTIWMLHYGNPVDNSGALSKIGLTHPFLFSCWGVLTFLALYANIILGIKKADRLIKPVYILTFISAIGMILTLCCDFDYNKIVQYYLHCIGSMLFSIITGMLVFALFAINFKKSVLHKIATVIIGIILLSDLILLLIFKETGLIEAVPVIFGLITLPIFNFLIKDKKHVTQRT